MEQKVLKIMTIFYQDKRLFLKSQLKRKENYQDTNYLNLLEKLSQIESLKISLKK